MEPIAGAKIFLSIYYVHTILDEWKKGHKRAGLEINVTTIDLHKQAMIIKALIYKQSKVRRYRRADLLPKHVFPFKQIYLGLGHICHGRRGVSKTYGH